MMLTGNNGSDGCPQTLDPKRFVKEPVDILQTVLVGRHHFNASGDHDDGLGGSDGLDGPSQLIAFDARHVEVGNDEVKPIRPKQGQRLRAVGGSLDMVPVTFEAETDCTKDQLLIVNNQDI